MMPSSLNSASGPSPNNCKVIRVFLEMTELNWKSEVCRVRPPVVLTTFSDTQPFSLINCGRFCQGVKKVELTIEMCI